MFLNTFNSKKQTTSQLLKIIEDATIAEINRDHQTAIKSLKPVWENIEVDPDFSHITQPAIKAELYRLAGFLLCYYGKSKIKKHYLERARPLITKSINLFHDVGLKEKSDEANISLALCYWYLGDPENSEMILSQVETDYEDYPFDSPYLLVKITRSLIFIAKEEFDKALDVIKSLEDKIRYSSNHRLKMSYHNKAGAMYLHAGKYDEALRHFSNGIKQSIEMNSLMFQGSQFNNIAAVYKLLAKNEPDYFEDAFENIDKALKLFEETDAPGWRAVTLDTKADILLEKGDYDLALEAINESIELMRSGDDKGVLTDALYLRSKIHFKLNALIEGFADVTEAIDLARLHIGEFKVNQIKQKIDDIVYIKNDSTLIEVDRFKKDIVRRALIKNNNHREKSAQTLGITRGGLHPIIKKKFPELVTELNIDIRDWSPYTGRQNGTDDFIDESEEPVFTYETNSVIRIPQENLINVMNIDFDRIFYPGKKESDIDQMKCFYIPRELGFFEDDDDIVVLCNIFPEFSSVKCLIVARHIKSRRFLLALAGNNELKKSPYIQSMDDGKNLDANDYKIVGKIIAYCSGSDSVGDVVIFKTYGGN